MSIGNNWWNDFDDMDNFWDDVNRGIDHYLTDGFLEIEEVQISDYKEKESEFNTLYLEYLDKRGRNIEEDNHDIIPGEFAFLDIDLRIKILRDALNKQISIEKSELFPSAAKGPDNLDDWMLDWDKETLEEDTSVNDYKFNKRDNDQYLDNFIDKLIKDSLNLTPEQLKKKMDYTALLSQYLCRFGREIDEDYGDIIPLEFEIFDGIDLKIIILQDALNKQITIEQSEFYNSILEGNLD